MGVIVLFFHSPSWLLIETMFIGSWIAMWVGVAEHIPAPAVSIQYLAM